MWLGHHFQGQKFKGEGHQAAQLTAALTPEEGAEVTVRTHWAWGNCYVASAQRRAWCWGANYRGGAYHVATRASCLLMPKLHLFDLSWICCTTNPREIDRLQQIHNISTCRDVVDLLYNKLIRVHNKSTTNRSGSNGVWIRFVVDL